jgi:hypothetical protein
VELLRRYSKHDTFQRSVFILSKSLVRSDNGTFLIPSPRPQTTPPDPFKLTQRLTPTTITKIIERYKAGEPSTAIANTFNISKGSVIRLLREAGTPIRKPTTDQRPDRPGCAALYRWEITGPNRRAPQRRRHHNPHTSPKARCEDAGYARPGTLDLVGLTAVRMTLVVPSDVFGCSHGFVCQPNLTA